MKENYSSEILFLETKIGSFEYESFLDINSNFDDKISEFKSYLSTLKSLEKQYKEKDSKEKKDEEKREKGSKRRVIRVLKPKTEREETFINDSFAKKLQNCVTFQHYRELMTSFVGKINELPFEV